MTSQEQAHSENKTPEELMDQIPSPEPLPESNVEEPVTIKARIERTRETFREWLGLPLRIRALAPQSKLNLRQLRGQLILYRLDLLQYQYYANNVDTEIWGKYHWCYDELSRLEKANSSRWLRIRSLKYLQDLYNDWTHLQEEQNDLEKVIEGAPEAASFYNKMMVHKESHQRSRELDEEYSQKLSRAYAGLESALEYVEKFNREHDLSIFGASALRFEDARVYWDDKLNQIEQLESRPEYADRIVIELEILKKSMYEAPALAKWIHEVEERFTRLMYDHDLLLTSVGKAVISQEEISEMRENLENVIPRLWATGQRDQLDHFVKSAEGFLKVYEPEVESEISFAERHRIRKEANQRGLGEQGLKQIIDLTKLLVSAMEAREPYMMNHSITVAQISMKIAKQMNWSEDELQFLELAALLHDVGKAWIPENLLNKEGELTDIDRHELRKHAVYASQILESLTTFNEIVPWIYHHHERWDGKGYPDGLRGEDIPIASRIIAVAESFHSMTTGTPNRNPMPSDTALQVISAESERAYDPIVVDAFIEAMKAADEE